MNAKKKYYGKNSDRSDLKVKKLNRQAERIKVTKEDQASADNVYDDFDSSTRDSSGTAIDVNPQPRMGESSGDIGIS
jgi:hypothetical protein